MKLVQQSILSGRGLVAVFICVAFTFTGTVVATDQGPVDSALSATESAMTATVLADQVVVIAGGGLLVGLGLSIVVSSVFTYRHKNKQIRSRLK